MNDIRIGELIEYLQNVEYAYGDIKVFEGNDWKIQELGRLPAVKKVYYRKYEEVEALQGERDTESVTVKDEDLYDVDKTKPIEIGIEL